MKSTSNYGACSDLATDINDIVNEESEQNDSTRVELKRSKTCECSYLIEPVAFIYNMASSIISISLGQFIYAKILNRLIDQENHRHNHTTNYTDLSPTL